MFLKGEIDQITLPIRATHIGDMRKKVTEDFKATYLVMPPKEAKALVARFSDDDDDFAEEDLVLATLVDVADLRDDKTGEPHEYSDELVERMLRQRGYLAALVQGFMESQFGPEAVNAKN